MTSPDQWRGGVEGARGDGRGAWPAPPPSQLHQPQAPCQVGVSHAASTSTQLTLPSLHPPPPGLHLHTSTLHPPAAPHGHIWPQQATTAALKCRCRCCVHVLFHHIRIDFSVPPAVLITLSTGHSTSRRHQQVGHSCLVSHSSHFL